MKKSRGKNWKKVKTINLENLGNLTIKGDIEMNDNVERWTLEDGRRVEKVTTENQSGDEIERVTEVRIDEERPKIVQQKIVEKIKPIVYQRKVENLDTDTGEVLNEKTEVVDTRLKDQKENVFVTREEMVEAIVSAVKSIKSQSGCSKSNCAKMAISNKTDSKLNSLGIADEIKSKSKKIPIKDLILLGIITLQVLGLIYLIFS